MSEDRGIVRPVTIVAGAEPMEVSIVPGTDPIPVEVSGGGGAIETIEVTLEDSSLVSQEIDLEDRCLVGIMVEPGAEIIDVATFSVRKPPAEGVFPSYAILCDLAENMFVFKPDDDFPVYYGIPKDQFRGVRRLRVDVRLMPDESKDFPWTVYLYVEKA